MILITGIILSMLTERLVKSCCVCLLCRCTATIGQLYSEAVTGRAVFLKPDPGPDTVPVLGEPLMCAGSHRTHQPASTSLFLVLQTINR